MSNKKFESMTKAEQRVAIAKDVIKQIHAGMVEALSGEYLIGIRGGVAHPKKPCRACVLGALFVSIFKLTNCEWLINPTRDELHDTLSPYFLETQLRDIERAFEGWDRTYFWREYLPNDEDRMIAIMQNSIDHKGAFKPEVMYEVS